MSLKDMDEQIAFMHAMKPAIWICADVPSEYWIGAERGFIHPSVRLCGNWKDRLTSDEIAIVEARLRYMRGMKEPHPNSS